MSKDSMMLSSQERNWILERRVTRIEDQKEVQIYPMGAERYLSSVLAGKRKKRYNILDDIKNKDVLVIPGFGNSCFLFARAGAKSVTVYDKDPVTIAWIKAFKKFYHYRESFGSKIYPSIGELLNSLTSWYPPLVLLPNRRFKNILLWASHPNGLRRIYIHYMIFLTQKAVQESSSDNFELNKNINFYAGTIDTIESNKKQQIFDTAFIPYLLGVKNGIEQEEGIVKFIQHLFKFIPKGNILVNPTRRTKEFYITGKRYFVTTKYSNIKNIPGLDSYVFQEDENWFGTQGLTVFRGERSN